MGVTFSTDDMIYWEYQVANDVFTSVSEQAIWLGYPLDAWKTSGFFGDLILPADRTATLERIASLTTGDQHQRLRFRVVTADGRIVWVDQIVTVTDCPESGTLLTGFFIDLSPHKKLEEKIAEGVDHYRSVFRSIAEGIVVQDRHGQILQCNPAAEEILGLTIDQLCGRSSLDPRWRAVSDDGSDLDPNSHPAMVTLRTGEPIRNFVMGIGSGSMPTDGSSIETIKATQSGWSALNLM